MNIRKPILRSALIIVLGCFLAPPVFHSAAADASLPVPAIVQKGFDLWAERKAASWAIDVWKIGGLLESDSKPALLSRYFGRLDRNLGNYKSYEVIDTKQIGSASQVLYLGLRFEHAIIYGRFLLYRTDKEWVVQNMDFSARPEAIMPWLAFTGQDYAE